MYVYVVFDRSLYTVTDSEEAAQYAIDTLPESVKQTATYIAMPVYSLKELQERLSP